MYQIRFTKRADKQFRKLPVIIRKQIAQKMEIIAKNPYTPNNNIISMEGVSWYRLRVGNYRVIYDIHNKTLVIEVIKLGHRKEVYTL